MKNILLLFLALAAAVFAKAQTDPYPKGVYMSFEEIVDKTPLGNLVYIPQKRTRDDIRINGGNDYMLKTDIKVISDKQLKNRIRAYCDGDRLFINCKYLKLQDWYTPVLDDGKYIVFKAAMSQNNKTARKQKKQAVPLAATLGVVGEILKGNKMAQARFLYALDKATGDIVYIEPQSLAKLLSQNEELAGQYAKENNQGDEEVMIKYLKLLNRE